MYIACEKTCSEPEVSSKYLHVDIRGTATPVDDDSYSVEVTIPGPITTPELVVPFSGLHAAKNYAIEIEAASRNDASTCIGVGINNLFLQTDHQTYTSGELVYVAQFSKSLSATRKIGKSLRTMS